MHSQLPFFPPSLPDESLISRVSRYHIISGNRTEQSTFGELFARTPFGLDQVVPFSLEILASRLPGENPANLAGIIHANTLFPLFRPFIGKPEKAATTSSGAYENSFNVTHMPRHVVGMSGNAKLCLSCVREDAVRYGAAYWHRSHQIPGVTACYKHKEALISSCPNCRFPFQRPKRLLTAPWLLCRCSEPLPLSNEQQIQPIEIAYASYAHELLLENIPPVVPDGLINIYREKVKERGFARASLPALKEFQEAMIDSLGHEFISKVDPAFSANKTTWWLRFSYIESALDMPITRHLMLGMHLFGTANNFSAHVQAAPGDKNASSRKKSKAAEQNQHGLRDEYRRKISAALKKEPSISMEKLWKKHYRPIAWLFDNDKAWLVNSVDSQDKNGNASPLAKSLIDEASDREFALLAERHSRKLFEQGGRPERVTIGKILAGLPKKIDPTKNFRERYPLLFATIDVCKESSWCFSARKIIWALGEIERLDENVTTGNIVLKAGVVCGAVDGIMRFCAWDGAKIGKEKISPQVLLAKAGITRTWRGPSDMKLGDAAGRGYAKKKFENA